MFRNMLKSKIHHARVTEADLHYVGSVTIDRDLLRLVDILPNEKVLVINNNNGARFETYAFEGKAGSGVVCMNGGCARHVHVGDTVIIAAFGWMEDAEAKALEPKVVFLDEKNRVVGGFPPSILPDGTPGAPAGSTSPSAAPARPRRR